ncbi:hypothetical protein BH23ACT5_BH23ACT5_14890 [soil metagenome]
MGRQSELDLFGAVLGEEPPASIVFVFGTGGIGKSALLREVQRRAVRRGYRVRSIDGRLSAGPSGELEQARSWGGNPPNLSETPAGHSAGVVPPRSQLVAGLEAKRTSSGRVPSPP